jgi:hypothetical protein
MMRVLHGPNGPIYKDEDLRTFIMDDFGNAIPLEGKILEQATAFLISAFIYNKDDTGF